MKFSNCLHLLLAGLQVLSHPVEGNRLCGAPELSTSEIEEAEAQFQQDAQKHGIDITNISDEDIGRNTFFIDTYWHVIHNGNNGRLSQAQVDESMRVLNAAFADSNSRFQFNLIETTYSDNLNWYLYDGFQMAQELHRGDCSTANIYSTGMLFSLGFVTHFPWELTPESCTGSAIDDGMYIRHTTIPGGSEPSNNLGAVLVHEAGHWMGLYHTFQGGCFGSGDMVSDTPAQAYPTWGCPSPAPDTCPGGGDDPIENYMDYSDDTCSEFFTEGQVSRMFAQYTTYRGDVPPATPSPGGGGGFSDGICFSPDATAVVQGRGRVFMKDLAVGDSVLTASGQYHPIYTMNHFHHTKPTNFLQISADLVDDKLEAPLELSPLHMVYIQGKEHPVPAIDVQVGDYVQTLQYGPRKVLDIQLVGRNGLYNPITADGTMVVDGIIASSYTSFTGSAYLEIAGTKIISVHNLLDMTIAPYRAFCMATSSMNILCNQHGEDELPTVVELLRNFYGFFSQQYAPMQFLIIGVYLSIFGLMHIILSKYSMFLVASAFVFIRSNYNKNIQHNHKLDKKTKNV